MAKRFTKAERSFFVAVLVVGLPIFVAAKIFDGLGPIATTATILTVAAVIVIVIGIVVAKRQKRASLLAKYGDPQVVERILSRTLWVGETSAQLRDSLGAPLDVDESVLKTKRRETWKYLRKSAKRYGLRVTVENGIVVAWDQKS